MRRIEDRNSPEDERLGKIGQRIVEDEEREAARRGLAERRARQRRGPGPLPLHKPGLSGAVTPFLWCSTHLKIRLAQL